MSLPDHLMARTPSAQLRIGDVNVPVSRVTLQHDINDLPQAQFVTQVQNDVDGALKVDLAGLTQLNRAAQEKLLNRTALTPDVGLTLADGNGETLKFRGFLGRPSFHLMNGQLQLGFSAVHAGAVLQAFNPQIYSADEFWGLENLQEMFEPARLKGSSTANVDPLQLALGDISKSIAFLAGQDQHKTDSVTQRLRVMVQALHDRFVLNPDLFTGRGQMQPVFNLNAAALSQVLTCLQKSEPYTLIHGLSSPDFDDTPLLQTLYTLLINSPNFYATLAGLCQAFLMQVNAEWGGDIWVEQQFCNQPAEGRFIKVPISDCVFDMAHLYEPRLLQVLVQGPGMPYYALQGNYGPYPAVEAMMPAAVDNATIFRQWVSDGASSLRAIAAYPATLNVKGKGTFYVVQAPSWTWPTERQIKEFITEEDVGGTSKFNTYPRRMTAMLADWTRFGQARQHVLDYLAEATFRDLLLRDTSAMVTVPLNAQARVGRTYTVYDLSGTALFDGFLHSVVHDLQVSEDGQAGSATTQLRFSHVIVAGAMLENLTVNNVKSMPIQLIETPTRDLFNLA